MMTTTSGRISRKKKNIPAGASRQRRRDHGMTRDRRHPASPGSHAPVESCGSETLERARSDRVHAHADLKRAMISARSGLVSVAAAPNSSVDKKLRAG